MINQGRLHKILDTPMAGLNSITPPPDFGPNLTLAAYVAKINALTALLDNYNQAVAALDDLQNQLNDTETDLRVFNKRMLAAAEAHYGPDSSQYEQAGGTRQSDPQTPDPQSAGKGRELIRLSNQRRS